MALHSSDIRPQVLPHGEVMTEGYSFQLALDQLGFFSTSKKTKDGLKAISDFKDVDTFERLKLAVGTEEQIGVSATNKATSSVHFTLKDVVKAGIAHPKNTEQKVDYFRVGWDGLNADTSLEFFQGQDIEFQFTMEGMPVTLFNATDRYTVKVPISIPGSDLGFCANGEIDCEPVSCKEHTINLVKAIKNYALPTGQKLTQYFDVHPIFSVPTVATKQVVYKYWELEYCGSGANHELGRVQAQYPTAKVVRDTMSDKFVLLAPEAYTPADFVVDKKDVLKGCDTCPSGYEEVEDGILYSVKIEDDGLDKTADVEAISENIVADSVVKVGQEFGIGTYLIVLSEKMTETERETFLETNVTAEVRELGTKKAHCTNDTTASFAWVAKGEISATEAEYELLLSDDCEGNRLEDLQREYPDLEIEVVESANCVTRYKTKVTTDFSASKGCSNAIIEQVYTSEAPRQFGLNGFWTPVVNEAEEGSVLCGFEIKAKPVVMNPTEAVLDKLPFIFTSTRISSIAGGYPVDYSITTRVPNRQFTVTQLERAQDLDNLGGRLRGWEKRGNIYFKNEQYSKDPVQRELIGGISKLDGLVQYSLAFVEIAKENKAGINQKEYTNITYGFFVPYGKTENIESVLKSLAGSAGVPFLIQ